MNRVRSRAYFLLLLVIGLCAGLSFFVAEYFAEAETWVFASGSPHIYDGVTAVAGATGEDGSESLTYIGTLGCGVITDRSGYFLADLNDGRTYADSAVLRMATLHWLGDREKNISTPALSYYSEELCGFDPISGLYTYGGIGGQMTLTLCAEMQIAALEAMGDYKGTIAVYNYQTGEILCAISTPTFDPDDVPDIAGDTTGAYTGAYVNRFTRSTYTPGSVFKIVTLAAALAEIPDIESRTFTCTGEVVYGEDSVTCMAVHGTQTLQEAFTNSCNCAFAQIANELGAQTLLEYAEALGLTESLEFDGITTAAGSFQAAIAAVDEAWSGIGQYTDLVNPCSFLTMVGAIANGGTAVSPYIVESIEVSGKTTYQAKTTELGTYFSAQIAEKLQQYLRANVELYYGDENFSGLTVAAKTGTAEVGSGNPTAVFTGFVLDEKYPFAFIAIVEDSGFGRQIALPMVAAVLQSAVEALGSS